MIGDLSKRQLLIVGAVGVIALAAIGAIGFTAMTGDTTPGEQADGAENPSADAESDLSSEDLPDGLTLDKGEVTVDESVLHSAHVEALSNTSFSMTTEIGTEGQDRTIVGGADSDAVTYEFTSGERIATAYSNGEDAYFHENDVNGELHYRVVDPQFINREMVMNQRLSGAVVTASNLKYAGRVSDDPAKYRLEIASVSNAEGLLRPLQIAGELESATGYVVVNEQNVIEELQITTESSLVGGEPVEDTRTVSMSDVGDTAIDEPSWLSDAEEQAIDFSVEESDTGISMTHDSGDDVAEGMTVGVIAEESRYMAETPSDVGVGDTLHVSVVDGELAASVNSPIEGGEAISNLTQVVILDGERPVFAEQVDFGDESSGSELRD
jgi:hypothetical protein